MSSKPKLSIITPSYNQGIYIEDMLKSIQNQDYDNFEHIILDACSTDQTAEVVKKYNFSKFICEKDNGPASAINKGFKIATGDIFCWINTDDYFEKNVFKLIVDTFEKNNAEFVYGNLTYVDANKKVLICEKTTGYSFHSLTHINPFNIRQPSSMFTRKIFEKVGGLDEKLKTVFDYEMFVRMFKIIEPVYIDHNLSYYRDHAETITRTMKKKQSRELLKIVRKNGAKLSEEITKLLIRRSIFG